MDIGDTYEVKKTLWGAGGPYTISKLLASGAEGDVGVGDGVGPDGKTGQFFVKELNFITMRSDEKEREVFVRAQSEIFQIFGEMVDDTFVSAPLHFFGCKKPERYIQIFELYEGEDLWEHLEGGKIPLEQRRYLVNMIASGLAAIHERGLAMMDLKPQNIFISEKKKGGTTRLIPALIDLTGAWKPGYEGTDKKGGAISEPRGDYPGRLVYTQEWGSPELNLTYNFLEKNKDKKATDIGEQYPAQPSDVFIAGQIFYEMLCGQALFNAKSPKERRAVTSRIWKDGSPKSLLELNAPDISQSQNDIIMSMLAKMPDDRPTMREVQSALVGLGAQTPEQPIPVVAGKLNLTLDGSSHEVSPGVSLMLNQSSFRKFGTINWQGNIGLLRHFSNVGWACKFNNRVLEFEVNCNGVGINENNWTNLIPLSGSGQIIVKSGGKTTVIEFNEV
jgi:serine/threonine protein kinase